MSSLQEQATINFYTWEVRGRGYYHFDDPIDIEPPFTPFIPLPNTKEKFKDDGAISFLGGIKKLFFTSNGRIPDEEPKDSEIVSVPINPQPKLECVGIVFSRGTTISISFMLELVNLLSFSRDTYSFEILAQRGRIEVQFTAHKNDYLRLFSHIKAFFPSAILKTKEALDIDFDFEKSVAIADFGLDNEFMLSIAQSDNLNIDPLTSIIAVLGTLNENEIAIFQVIFKGVTAPWSAQMQYAVSDGKGGSFFEGHPEFVLETKNKVSSPLFSVVIRVGAQGENDDDSKAIVQELAKSITRISTSQYNRLIPLSNEGYAYNDHLRNIFYRTSNRFGCILNTKELTHFVHYPNKTIVNEKLGLTGIKTKRQSNPRSNGIYLGDNIHHGETYPVLLDMESRLSHTHILGATGVGKSTLIANMLLEDINQGLGCALFDPHGDICDDVLKRIPKNRINDVVFIDPSDIDFPIGFNLLEAKTEAQKIVLSSDIVSAFKRHASAWGDTMTSVLQNAVNTILENKSGGTLIELKRFLIEDRFRSVFLQNVNDPSLHYYWNNEYPMVKKRIAPLLTRIDTFLRPKLVRYMLAQKKGIDISECLAENKIVLLKLSQGLIGEENSYLLGSLFLAKFNQSALARQNQTRVERKPFMLYLDEFHNFITPSIERILSGARKYKLGITIAHQELGQIQDTSLLNSVLSNPKTRICFRLGDNDSKKLEAGFSHFKQSDLQSLNRGEVIMRIGSSINDFNLTTKKLSDVSNDYSNKIIKSVREKYTTSKEVIEELLIAMLPYQNKAHQKDKISPPKNRVVIPKEKIIISEPKKKKCEEKLLKKPTTISAHEREKIIAYENESTEIRTHTYLQSMIKKLGQDRNYKATTEYLTKDGGRIDVVLEQNGLKIGFEISETNTPAYEVQNIKKCLKAGCIPVIMISKNKNHLNAIQKLANAALSKKDRNLVKFLQPDEIPKLLDGFAVFPQNQEEVIKGFRIVTEFENDDSTQMKNIKSRLVKIFKKKK
jgi:DNA helicase HerA-like ATPase